MHTIRATLAALTLAALTVIPLTVAADDVKMPQTADDHEGSAKSYKEQAAQYRKTSEDHKQMAIAYKKTMPETKGRPNPWAVKMAKHCAALSASADKLARDADKAAEFHTFRATELQTK